MSIENKVQYGAAVEMANRLAFAIDLQKEIQRLNEIVEMTRHNTDAQKGWSSGQLVGLAVGIKQFVNKYQSKTN